MSEQAPSTADFLARIALLETAVSARDTTIAERDEQLRRERAGAALRIQRLQLRIDRFNRKAFGRSSEKLGQMRLELEDLETDFATSVPDLELPIVADTDKVRVVPVRKLNPNLPRKRVVREPSCACCPGCGGDLRAMGDDSDSSILLKVENGFRLWSLPAERKSRPRARRRFFGYAERGCALWAGWRSTTRHATPIGARLLSSRPACLPNTDGRTSRSKDVAGRSIAFSFGWTGEASI
ncbi:transposase [Mesorhizobium sp. M0954]|uniref:transposase n=1 Tax=Mesorhizobium sp. M0954 TaxID=2957032 RepID=UPI00333AEBB0